MVRGWVGVCGVACGSAKQKCASNQRLPTTLSRDDHALVGQIRQLEPQHAPQVVDPREELRREHQRVRPRSYLWHLWRQRAVRVRIQVRRLLKRGGHLVKLCGDDRVRAGEVVGIEQIRLCERDEDRHPRNAQPFEHAHVGRADAACRIDEEQRKPQPGRVVEIIGEQAAPRAQLLLRSNREAVSRSVD